MSTYDKPDVREYAYPATNLAAAFSRIIRGPAGKTGRVRDVLVGLTVTPAGATTTPVVQVGALGTLGAYAVLPTGTQAAPSALVASAVPKALVRDPVSNIQPLLPADTDVYINVVPASGTGLAGTGDIVVTIEWF